jgi:large subunit ribosomal protein L13
VATVVAKTALSGKPVEIINAEKMLIKGKPKSVVKEWREMFRIRDIAKPEKSPRLSRRPDMFVKRSIRGMLPRRTKRGEEALKRIKVYMGDEGKKGERVWENKNPDARKITILELCRALGWKG